MNSSRRSANSRLDRLGDAAVDGAAALGQDAAVGRFLHQRVLEDVFQLGQLLPQADQLGVLELRQAAVHGVAGLGNRLQDAQEEAAADHRGELQHTLHAFLEPVDARHDHALDGVGKRQGSDRPGQAPGTVARVLDQRALGDQGRGPPPR